MLLENEHRRFVCDKMRLLVVKTALKFELGKVRSGVLETVEKSTMAVDRAVPITMINFLSADFDRRWLDRKRFVSRIDRCVDLENRTRIRCFAPLRVFPSARKVMYLSASRKIEFSGWGRIKACDGSPESL